MVLNKSKWKVSLVVMFVTFYVLTASFGTSSKEILANTSTQKEEFSAKTFYTEKCLACHTPDGRPKRPGVTDLTLPEYQKSRTDEQIATAIMNGNPPKMPAYKSKLDKDKLKGLVTYIRAFERK